MTISLKDLGIDKLNLDHRLVLAQEIWNTIPVDSADVPLTESQRTELDRRLADHEANPNDVVSWQDAQSAIRSRLNK